MATLDFPTLTDCGCKARVYADGSGVDIEYCKEHQAGPALAKKYKRLLEAAREVIRWADPDGMGYRIGIGPINDLRKLIE